MKGLRLFHEDDVIPPDVKTIRFPRHFRGRFGERFPGDQGRMSGDLGASSLYPDYLINNLTRRVAAVNLWKTDPSAPA